MKNTIRLASLSLLAALAVAPALTHHTLVKAATTAVATAKPVALPANDVIGLNKPAILYNGYGDTKQNTGHTLDIGSTWRAWETANAAGTTWYRIGTNQWVEGASVGALPLTTRQSIRTVVQLKNDEPLWRGLQESYAGRWLPTGSRWQAFEVATTSDGQQWYRLDGDEWVNAKAVTAAQPAAPTGSIVSLPANDVIGLNRSTLLYNGYGAAKQSTGQTLAVGTAWRAWAKVESAGTTWYKIGTNQWVDGAAVGALPLASWQSQRAVVQLKNDEPLWNGLQGSYAGQWLTKNSRWQAFGVATTSDGQKWYLIGVNQWVNANAVTVDATAAQQNGTASVNQLSQSATNQLNDRLASEQFNGTLLLVRNGQVIFHNAYGMADAAANRANTVQSLYQIASVEKSLTGVLVAQAASAGQLSYDDNIHQYFPSVPAEDNITIRDLLDMRSGLSMTDAVPTDVLTDNQVIQRALDLMQYDPSQHGVSNYQGVNYNLLTGILEKVTGQSYEELVQQRFFSPLGLGADQAGFAWNLAAQPNHTVSYITGSGYSQTDNETVADMHSELGTGNIYMTSFALYRLEQAIVQGKIISQNTLAGLWNATDGSFRGGLYNQPDHYYAHGVKASQETIFLMSPDGKTAVVYIDNREFDIDNALSRGDWYWQFVNNAPLAN